MNRREWIRKEIATWRSEGVVGDDVAERLLARYAPEGARLSWGAMLAGAFGALLIGLGVIALLAANWQCFGRGERAAIALAPVLLCGGLAVLATWKGCRTMSLWEPLGILWFVSTGAATCLIAQTYQVGGSVPGLILFVALLTLPVVWVTRSVAAMAVWPVLAISWGIAAKEVHGEDVNTLFAALALLALSVPAFVAFLRRDSGRAARVTGCWALGLVYSLGTAILFLCHMSGCLRDGDFVVVFWGCSLVVLLAGVFCKISCWPLVATLVAFGAAIPTPFARGWVYMAALVLALAIAVVGIRRVRLTYTNVGAALFLWLVLVKFFESRVDFTTKGLVLIVAGAALTALNVVMLKLKKRRAA